MVNLEAKYLELKRLRGEWEKESQKAHETPMCAKFDQLEELARKVIALQDELLTLHTNALVGAIAVLDLYKAVINGETSRDFQKGFPHTTIDSMYQGVDMARELISLSSKSLDTQAGQKSS